MNYLKTFLNRVVNQHHFLSLYKQVILGAQTGLEVSYRQLLLGEVDGTLKFLYDARLAVHYLAERVLDDDYVKLIEPVTEKHGSG